MLSQGVDLLQVAVTIDNSAKLSRSTKILYGLGTVAFGVKDQGFNFLLLIFYNQVIGLPAQAVGSAILVALLIDAFLDPVVGQISDNWRSRWGRRHPFMYAAAIPAALSYALLWTPPKWPQEGVLAYLIVTTIVIRSFITLYEIPSSALGAELTRDYDERTSLMSIRYFFGWLGGLGMALAALQIFLKPDATHPVGQLNPTGYLHYGMAAGLVILVAILVSTSGTHRFIARLSVPAPHNHTIGELAREMISTLSHRPFLVLLLTAFCNAAGQGLVQSLSLYVSTYFWGLGAAQISLFVFAGFVATILASVFATPLSRRVGKKTAAICCQLLALTFAASPIVLRLLNLFPGNEERALLPILMVFTVLSTTFSIMTVILIASMMADVVEDSEKRTGRRSEGLFMAANAFVNKAVSGLGIFTASMMLAFVGFPDGASPGQVPADVIRNLGITYVPFLAVLYGAAALMMSRYSISRSSHEQTLRELAATKP